MKCFNHTFQVSFFLGEFFARRKHFNKRKASISRKCLGSPPPVHCQSSGLGKEFSELTGLQGRVSRRDGARPLVGQRETGRENRRDSFSWRLMVGVYLARKDQQNQCMVSTRLIYLTGLMSFDGPEFTKPNTPLCHFLGPTVAQPAGTLSYTFGALQ